jgi:hypothetical protein
MPTMSGTSAMKFWDGEPSSRPDDPQQITRCQVCEIIVGLLAQDEKRVTAPSLVRLGKMAW